MMPEKECFEFPQGLKPDVDFVAFAARDPEGAPLVP
jgi:hypothetical protein